MTTLERFRNFWPRDRVFDFLVPQTPPDLDLTHGVILYLEGISVSFGGFKAIDDLNLYIEDGELRCIIGPNGAGKSTLMDIVTGKTRPDAGSAWFGQQINLLKLSEPEIARAGIGRKFQKPTVFENHTVRDNLELAMAGPKEIWPTLTARLNAAQRERIESVLETVGLQAQIHCRAGALSHGQKQWLEIGMLLMQNPKLLLVDEPVAGMTQQESERTAELLVSLAGPRSVVVVEHDMEFVRSIARKVTVLHQGRVLAEGSMDDVQHDPRVVEVYLGGEPCSTLKN
jgi:urea transport system ATP-binding protein